MKSIKESVNKTLLDTIGITYDEYEELDRDEQLRLISEYHKKNPNKSDDALVMIGGGDESIIMRAKKGERIITTNGVIIAGETLEENKKRWEEKFLESDKKWKEFIKKQEKEERKANKLDFKTWLFLYLTCAIRVDHPQVYSIDYKKIMPVRESKSNEVYVFRDYEEYKNYFLMYLDEVYDDVIKLAIYTRSSKGHIIALKGLCEHIIVTNKVNKFFNSITPELEAKIHAKGKLTPAEAVELWESHDLCINGSKTEEVKSRCSYFGYNCHTCLREVASHKYEHEPIDFKLTNSINDEKVLTRK